MKSSNEYMEAYSKLGPFCPQCGRLASNFYMQTNTNNEFEGRIECNYGCYVESHMVYRDNNWRFIEEKNSKKKKN